MTNIIQDIFKDHFDNSYFSKLNVRDTVFDNVRRMTSCGDFKSDFTLFGYDSCGSLKKIAFTCKSRFCTPCGNLYSKRRATNMSFKLVRASHRHCVFTIPKELRNYFRADLSLLNCLFHAVHDVVLRMFSMLSKSENFTPGFVMHFLIPKSLFHFFDFTQLPNI